ncbi:hypothetical protein HGM15179_021180 [Zosterops borbonicus]|uniref:Ig-like domain-containing protein n=1 Tax=Zosterops borbonicus TaxID=364589 RepID=A0A8K1D6H1_9PASS|nr:hypothetical protein HGM15179_021180 [Zosterops borbonicus]
MAGDTGMAGKLVLLLWAAQTTQLLVKPPWRPAVLWDRVTLTCQGLGTAGATTWYKDGQRWGQKGVNHFTVKESGTYTCDRPGTKLSPPVRVLKDPLVLQVQAQPLLEGDTLTLRCRFWRDNSVTSLNHSGQYHCRVQVTIGVSQEWHESAPVNVTVHELFTVPVLEGSPEPIEGTPLSLSCLSSPSPLQSPAPLLHLFYRDGQLVWGPQGSPHLLVPSVEVSHSGDYSCQVRSEAGAVQKSSARLHITVHMPVANVTITPSPPAHQVHAGDPVTLRCSVQVGSAPVTFTWLHNGQEVARGPVLDLGDVSVGHSGTYQCVATNQLGQDGHRVFWVQSPELALDVTPQGHWNTAVATGVGVSFLFLVVLVGVAVGWRQWNNMAARKHQERASLDPPAPPEEGEVLYTHVDPQVTYAELRGPHGQQQELSDIYGNVL